MPPTLFPAALALTLVTLNSAPAFAQEPQPEMMVPQASFVAREFAVPTQVEGPGFKLVPLGPELVDLDYQAYMGSIAHLQQTFTRSTGWPREDITAADAMTDMLTEQARFEARQSFAYAVLTPDGSRERGCVYVYPSKVDGYDAVVRLWVTKAEHDAGFDAELYAWTRQWIAGSWPFNNVAYPGRAISWEAWDNLVAKEKAD